MTGQTEILMTMDEAAEEARQDFMDNVVATAGKAKDVALWVEKWYQTAGYKRLCRILREYAE
jgi:hypothetical protein